jgi:polyisoprenoid-binding protein YceI
VEASRYRIAPERSHVWIDAKSSVHPIHSSTDGLEGYVELEMTPDGAIDFGTKPAGKLSLAVSRLSTGNRLEDRELQKRVDARRYPTIDGVLDQVERSGADGRYKVAGDITFRGVSRHYADQMTIEAVDGETIKLAGTSRIDVRDFGLQPPRMLMLRVEPEVDVRVEILAVKQA